MAGAVAMTLVREAASKTVSSVIAPSRGTTARFPNAVRKVSPCRSNQKTPPGMFLSWIALVMAATASPNRSALKPGAPLLEPTKTQKKRKLNATLLQQFQWTKETIVIREF